MNWILIKNYKYLINIFIGEIWIEATKNQKEKKEKIIIKKMR